MANPYGDIELSDPRAMRALAHPARLKILSRLQRHGPSTATALAALVGISPSVASWHLRHLASFGLVRDAQAGSDGRQRWWEAVARGFRLAMPDDEEGRQAFRLLSSQMMLQYEHLPRQWIHDVEPLLDAPWSTRGGLSNTRITVTAGELDRIEDAIEGVLAPYVVRADCQMAADARGVRLLRYVLPESAPDEAMSNASSGDSSAAARFEDR